MDGTFFDFRWCIKSPCNLRTLSSNSVQASAIYGLAYI